MPDHKLQRCHEIKAPSYFKGAINAAICVCFVISSERVFAQPFRY